MIATAQNGSQFNSAFSLARLGTDRCAAAGGICAGSGHGIHQKTVPTTSNDARHNDGFGGGTIAVDKRCINGYREGDGERPSRAAACSIWFRNTTVISQRPQNLES